LVTLTFVGGFGPIAVFDMRFDLAGEPGECDALLTGKAQLFTNDNPMTLRASISGQVHDCTVITSTIAATMQ
jgi:hypothetical protein